MKALKRLHTPPWSPAAVAALLLGLCLSSAALCLSPAASAQGIVPPALQGVTVEEKLGQELDPTLPFRDHTGKAVAIGDYFRDDKPVLLTLNYYACQTLCSVQLNALLAGLQELEWTAGEQFRIVTVSIDPDETPDLAAGKRASYLQSLGRGDVDWSFLVGDQAAITALADAVGFRYNYDAATDQYAHPAVIMFLAGDGAGRPQVARYLYGLQYPGRDIKFSLIESAEGRVGSPLEKLILSCFQYDVAMGRYTPAVMRIMQAGGVLMSLALAILGAIVWRRELAGRFNGSPT